MTGPQVDVLLAARELYRLRSTRPYGVNAVEMDSAMRHLDVAVRALLDAEAVARVKAHPDASLGVS